MKKVCPLSRFAEIMGKSKYRKKSEIKNARELPENILAKITQLKMQLNQKY